MITHILHGVHAADTTNVDVLLVRFALAHLNLKFRSIPLLSSPLHDFFFTRSSILDPRSSILDPQSSILDP